MHEMRVLNEDSSLNPSPEDGTSLEIQPTGGLPLDDGLENLVHLAVAEFSF
jgi:hypothetical protein